ncbi:unnamed protein product [Echinostoma caproni]|uniref:Cation_ATPase_C domain-containing protein n=1 Tax=Echinostoma caproni TaxID=27848 RepID=A0A3P8GPV0_9TREM|nr:unnamed protein product [Echinostoma caproni]
MSQLTRDYDLCLTGEGIEALRTSAPHLLHDLIPKAKVHARVVPKQKEDILVHLKRLGFVTLMCGDGTNDVGALKQAHVGVALLNEAGPAKSDGTRTAIQNSGTANSVDRRSHSNHTSSTRGDERQSAQTRLASQLAAIEAEQDPSLVRLGDASIAAPFTAKMSSPSGEAEARMPVKEDDFVDVHAEFEPSILNTVVYLISTSMQIATIAVNYKGHPFMESLLENKPIVVSLGVATGGVILLALGMFAEPLRLMRLDPQLQKVFFQAVAFDFIASWLVDRILVFIFGHVRVKSL